MIQCCVFVEAVSRHVDLTSQCKQGKRAQVNLDGSFQGEVSRPGTETRQVTS